MAQTSRNGDAYCPEKVTIFLNDYHSKYIGYFDTSKWYNEGTNNILHVLTYETGNLNSQLHKSESGKSLKMRPHNSFDIVLMFRLCKS